MRRAYTGVKKAPLKVFTTKWSIVSSPVHTGHQALYRGHLLKTTFCTQVGQSNSLSKLATLGGGIGILKGSFGAMVGMGGGVIAIPLLTRIAKLTQHQAHGTSLMGVLASGLVGTLTYYFYGSGEKSVDIPAAGLITTCAMATTHFAARWAHTIPGNKLSNLLGCFILLVTPLVFLKKLKSTSSDVVPVSTSDETSTSNKTYEHSLVFQSTQTTLSLIGIGLLTGVASGIFGIGGGMVMVPLLSLLTTQQMALGTSLLSMIGPSFVGSVSHAMMGTVHWKIVPTLLLGSGAGAYLGSIFSVSLTEDKQRMLFFATMLVMAGFCFRKGKPPRLVPTPKSTTK